MLVIFFDIVRHLSHFPNSLGWAVDASCVHGLSF
ncbi:hypothetical protein FB465_1992 [Kitasatospora atroaurantiaca]|uniref:Uncharacterized protein n=1 Tax=Kitasatospora atroaurantiaca TaxID=285545 RepID=A0A561EN00_9ACTN|nr:hypothetical protein FB465_1992 [Kitasatospora atroaurantiaca]